MASRPDSPLPDILRTAPSFLAFRLRNLLRVRLIERYSAEGLRPTQVVILLCIEVDPPPTQKRLIEVMGIDPSETVLLLDELQQQALIQRAPDPADRRRNLVILTPDGRAKVKRLKELIAATEDELFQPFSAEARATFQELLHALVSAADNRMTPSQVRAVHRSNGLR